MEQLTQLITNNPIQDISITLLIINMVIGYILSQVISFHFKRYGNTLASRDEFTQIFPFILMTTILIITVVKSSLALSLGLVGALSIVRFRTPIKEPEELAYLFLCIAAGLGLGANQTLLTIISALSILVVTAILKKVKTSELTGKNIYLTVNINEQGVNLIELKNKLAKQALRLNLRRTQITDSNTQATFLVEYRDISDLEYSISSIKKKYKKSEITFVDQSQLPGI